jgi:hypothetical protein
MRIYGGRDMAINNVAVLVRWDRVMRAASWPMEEIEIGKNH